MLRRLLLSVSCALVLGASALAQDIASGTHAIQTCSTSNASTYASGSFTPADGDLLAVFAQATDTQNAGTLTSSAGLTFFSVTTANYGTNVHRSWLFIAKERATATAQTVTLDVTGDAATGACISVLRITGVARMGAAAVRQSARQQNQAASGTPAPVFAATTLERNMLIGQVANQTNPAGLTPPTGWSEGADSGYTTPTGGQEYVFVNSGQAVMTVTWGSTSASVFGSLVAEIDASCTAYQASLGVGCN